MILDVLIDSRCFDYHGDGCRFLEAFFAVMTLATMILSKKLYELFRLLVHTITLAEYPFGILILVVTVEYLL